jgi:nitroreductase
VTTGLWADGRPTPYELEVVDWLLTTTRSARRTLDLTRSVEPDVIRECLRIATQAPTSHNEQRWHWVVVTDPAKRAMIADVYRRAWNFDTRGGIRTQRRWRGSVRDGEDAHRNQASAAWVPEHLAEVPVHVIPCLVGRRPEEAEILREWAQYAAVRGVTFDEAQRPSALAYVAAYWASIFPAVWSFQLALRSRGLGSVLTCMHLAYEAEVAKELRLPDNVTQACLVPVAYATRTVYRPAKRIQLERRMSWNTWMGQR